MLYIFAFILSSNVVLSQYKEDILGKDFEYRIINLKNDYEGPCISTLVRSKNNNSNKAAVLYIHGYNDYFFQKNLAKKITQAGYNFYAIDLRKYGRSHLENQKWFNFRDISEYYEELDSAINIISREGHKEIIINAHSTGGLISANYLNNRKEDNRIIGLLLNSPFFDFNTNWFTKNIILKIVNFMGNSWADKVFLNGGEDNIYGRALYKSYSFDTTFKKLKSYPKNYGWIKGISSGMINLKKSNIKVPIIVFSSDKSSKEDINNPLLYYSDVVLNVKDIKKVGKKLGSNVKLETIKNGIHDLSLSNKEPQDIYLDKLIFWIKNILPEK